MDGIEGLYEFLTLKDLYQSLSFVCSNYEKKIQYRNIEKPKYRNTELQGFFFITERPFSNGRFKISKTTNEWKTTGIFLTLYTHFLM